MSEPVLQTSGLKRTFSQGGADIHVLRGIDLTVGQGEIVALLGPSGSGKSTLLQAVGLLEGGFDYGRKVTFPASGLEGNLLRLPLIGVSVGLSSIAELQIDGLVRGDIRVGKLCLGPKGRIEGSVVAVVAEMRMGEVPTSVMPARSLSDSGWCTSMNSPCGRRRIRPDS